MKQNKMQIPEGYKNSALGIIPNDWEVKRLGEVAKLSSGGTPLREKKEYWGGDIPWITTTLLNNSKIYSAEEFITKEGLQNSATKLLPKNTILMAMYGQGQTRGKVSMLMINATTNQACAAFCNLTLDNEFFYYSLDSKYIEIRRQSNDGGQKNLSLELIKSLKISIPPLPQQQKIAEILGTWDEAIEKQNNLIDRLTVRKRGLMQQLLTGKKRLAGFSEEWKEVRLGEICEIKKGKAISSKEITNGIYPVIAGGQSSPYRHNKYTDENIITISASGAYAGYVALHKYKVWASDCSVIKSINDISSIDFLYAFLSKNQKYLYSLQSGGAQPHIYPNDISSLKYCIPLLPEQTAIANILTAADKEIELAKSKLKLLRSQKSGLMQELLTGKTRVKI